MPIHPNIVPHAPLDCCLPFRSLRRLSVLGRVLCAPFQMTCWFFLSGPSLRPPFDVRPKPYVGCHAYETEEAIESQEDAFTFKRFRTTEGYVRKRSPSPLLREKSRSPSPCSLSCFSPSFIPPPSRPRGRYTRSRSCPGTRIYLLLLLPLGGRKRNCHNLL